MIRQGFEPTTFIFKTFVEHCFNQRDYSSPKEYSIIQCIMSNKSGNGEKLAPGEGLRSLRSTLFFRVVNFELYTRPNMVIMALGLSAMVGCSAYIYYMRSKYEDMGYYTAVESDGKERFQKKQSKWDT